MSAARDELLAELALRIAQLAPDRRTLVAIDGVDGAGKTWLADELAARLADRRPVVRASVDGFHRPAAARYRLGRHSPAGFYLDSYDYPALTAALLEPFRRDGDCLYRSEVFDHVTDQPTDAPYQRAAPAAVLLLDGIFLHRSELAGYWDLSLWLRVDFAVSIPRGAGRGLGFGDPDPAAASNRRYIEGQRHYLATVEPDRRADLVIDNTELDRPFVVGPARG